MNCNIPGFETFGVEMLKEPLRNAGWGCYWHNPAGTFADWWLDGARHCIADCGFDGMYMDGTCYPELSANELDGMAWTDPAGNQHGRYPIWAIRDFIERLYVMLHCELKRTGGVDIHDGREPLHFIAGFSDTAVSGEYHLTRGKTILEVFDPHEFAAYYMTHLHGVARRFIWANWMKLPITENEMWSMVLLHDMYLPLAGGTPKYYWNYVGYDAKTQAWVRLRKIREAFDGAEFLPYWSERKPIAAEPGGPLASAWVDKEKRRALVVVSNLATKPWQGTVRFDTSLLGVGADAEVADAMFDQPLGRKAAEPVPVAIEPQRYRLFILNDRVPLPPKPKLDGSKP